jgi:GNAT superfamily N-acetyltransferase
MIRPAWPTDVPAMTALLNEIIAAGGTTAHQEPFSEDDFRDEYFDGPNAVCCHLAEVEGRVLGFQALGAYPLLPEGWLDIGTFVSASARGVGVGAALFSATKGAAQGKCKVINATIRADNGLGLAFYSRIGFEDYANDLDFALKDGRKVGRVSKRYTLV